MICFFAEKSSMYKKYLTSKNNKKYYTVVYLCIVESMGHRHAIFKLWIGKSWYKQTELAQIGRIHPPPSFSHYQASQEQLPINNFVPMPHFELFKSINSAPMKMAYFASFMSPKKRGNTRRMVAK